MWGHVAWMGYVVGVQAYDMDGDMLSELGHVAGCGECGRVWGNVARVVVGYGGMWQGYVVGGQAYGMDGDMLQEW